MRLVAASLLFLIGAPAAAYRVEAGDQMVHASAGGTFNFVRHRLVTRETPPSLLTVGLGYDYALTSSLSLLAELQPGLGDRYLGLPLAAGVRYRVPGLAAPLSPYATLAATATLGLPLGPPPLHVNVGVRAALGVEYFVSNAFAVGAEFALGSGPLLLPEFDLESRADLMLGCGYRF